MKEKLAAGIKKVFAVGQTALLLASLLALAGYIVAFIAGGETAVAIDDVIYNQIFPVMYFIAIALAFVGAVYLYLTGYRTFRFESLKKK